MAGELHGAIARRGDDAEHGARDRPRGEGGRGRCEARTGERGGGGHARGQKITFRRTPEAKPR